MRPDRSLTILAILLLAPSAACGHVESGVIGDGGFISGMLHPVTGLDHIVAMVAVGLWGAILGQPAIWMLPIVFPLVMAFGSILGIIGIPLPAINVGVALSGVILGTLVTTCARPPLVIAALLVSVFAIYHGYPHGSALPDFGVPILYVSGFVLSTGLLHISGITLGLLYRWRAGMIVVRLSGAVIAAVGGYYLLAAVGFAPAA
jgi:urease accessory protein